VPTAHRLYYAAAILPSSTYRHVIVLASWTEVAGAFSPLLSALISSMTPYGVLELRNVGDDIEGVVSLAGFIETSRTNLAVSPF
jgi:hypothetical protein